MPDQAFTWLPPRPLSPATAMRTVSLAPRTRPADLVPAAVARAPAAAALRKSRRGGLVRGAGAGARGGGALRKSGGVGRGRGGAFRGGGWGSDEPLTTISSGLSATKKKGAKASGVASGPRGWHAATTATPGH